MINNAAWKTILQTETDFSTVVEFYDADAVPNASYGFDPSAALVSYAAIDGLTFLGATYNCRLKSISGLKRTITGESNQVTVTLSNVDKVVSRFNSIYGFEGLILVVRLISRGASTTRAKSQILFVGRCEKPGRGSKNELPIKATWVLGGQNVVIPRRKYSKEDQEGRVNTDPNFEGFEFVPQQGVSSYATQVKRGGIAGFFGKKKWIVETQQWSSYSDLDSSKSVPEVFGTAQLIGTYIAYADHGTYINLRAGFCEGEISGFSNVRSLDPNMPLNYSAYQEAMGKTGAANATDPTWVGAGYYSRTAQVLSSSADPIADVNESAPDVAAVINGRLLTVPDSGGSWVTTLTWTNNAAAIARFIITSTDYFKLAAGWIDDAEAYVCWQYNDEFIIKRSLSDFTFLKAG